MSIYARFICKYGLGYIFMFDGATVITFVYGASLNSIHNYIISNDS
ncbi:MAG: hypothetical protein K0S47_3239 [Herbinix sp.]|nr:hypothetical protein [Herbinix sp.]